MGNFGFLEASWPDLHAESDRAERFAFVDPRTSCFYARRALELTLLWLYTADATLTPPYKDDLAAMLYEPTLRTLVGPALQAKMDVIRRQGNAAVHRPKPVSSQQSLATVRELFHVLYWVARTYATDTQHPPASLAFSADAVPRPGDVRAKTQAELKDLSDRLAAQDADLVAARERAEQSEAVAAARDLEIALLRTQVAAAKARHSQEPDVHDYDEALTRDLFVDLMLSEAGWALDQARDREFEVTGMPNAQGKGFVDYVLWGDDGKPLAVVEAKRTRKDAIVGQQQAKLYADCLEATFGQRPVIFYTNGYEHWLWDDLRYPPRQVQGFYSKSELALLIARRSTRAPLALTDINASIAGRPYQQRAIRAIDEHFEHDKQRASLLVMATGAGKTRTVIALVDQLMRANWAKRVLFLADRVALVTQAVGAFKEHLPDSSPVNLVTEKEADGRVYVSTYPTMMGVINQSDGAGRRFGPGYFDLIVIDEAHRSVYQKYGAIFTWFDSLLVGLTATPKDEVDHNTYRLFGLEDGVPTDAYSLDEAVAEGYLVPPRAVSVPLKFQRQGIRYHDLSEAERDEWDALDWGEEDPPDAVTAEALNGWLFNADTVDQVLKVLMTHGHKVAGGDRLGKTIIFAKNTDHANFISARFDLAYPEYAGHFARIITYKTEYAQSLIDDLSNSDKAPHIAISVDMLDTGIDIPEVVNLVFFKLVRSVSKFWQMLGRGTRLRPDLFGPGQHKTDFLVFDFCQNLEFFNADPATVDRTRAPSLGERLFGARTELVTALDKAGIGDGLDPGEQDGTVSERALRAETARHLHHIVQGMNLDNFVVRPARRWVEFYADDAAWTHLSPEEAAEAVEHLAGLPSAVRDDDERAKMFDLLTLRLQLSLLDSDPGADRIRRQVQQIATGLLEQTTIPVIKAQEALLAEVAGEEWWVDVTLPMLELMRRRLRGLVKLLERAKQAKVYTDFADELGEMQEIELHRAAPAVDVDRFRAKAREYLRAHLDHVALQKVRRNRQLTLDDLSELERMLLEAGVGDAEELAKASAVSNGLGVFVRSLVGLERDAASEAFSRFLNGATYTRAQIDFVWTIVTHLSENGVMDAERLYEPPFTDSAPTGPDGLFSGSDIDDLESVLHEVHRTANPGEVA
ncbi:DEAD/DEAH box helicase family protein [Actinotalea sp. K2]|uniref:DEAD/DEAH box helicase family protein n=1 Tax=Actinotalea sp. K2 TaxID=2939438 RepID=UPI0020171E4F|nr:DEAD/DEAH box helicase family protein [Actinotalea sp. K2]MCL3862048.1 DEAD/DEAH box helicase family protein [Actinotalea sp. K2]